MVITKLDKARFQSLVGTLKTARVAPRYDMVGGVSIPRRYAKNNILYLSTFGSFHRFNPS